MKITILGSGTSTGVPEVGCQCEVCTSEDEHDHRLRCSGLVEINGIRILIDCGPDFRQQMMKLDDFKPIDAVVISHEHYDHVGGLDDLRPFCRFRNIPIYGEEYVNQHLKERMPYCFTEHLYPGVPHILLKDITPNVPFKVSNQKGDEVDVTPIRVMHGKLPILGFRIGKMAWITDMLTMPDSSYELLQGLDVLVMNALRKTPHHTHQMLSEALENINRIQPKETYFIHMSHQIGLHRIVNQELPAHSQLAYDGQEILLAD